MTTVIVHDAIGANVSHLPDGPAAGYSTGSGDVPWTAAQWKAHPGAVRIDQDPGASDPTADILDVERGAATPASCVGWVKRASICYMTASRPGQRKPAIYVNRSNRTAVADALIAGGIREGVGLWLANPGMTRAAAEAMVDGASGPFPIIAVQYQFGAQYDTSVFSQAWLQEVSVTAPAKPEPPPGEWRNPAEWTWKDVWEIGIGLDGNLHVFHKEGGTWVKLR
jgi:hypothetical protein